MMLYNKMHMLLRTATMTRCSGFHGCTTALCSWPTAMRSWYNQSSLLCICMHASAGQANNVTALALESDGLQPTLVENKPCIQHPVLAGPHGTGPGPPHIGYEQGIKDKIIAHVETVLTGAPSVLAAAAFDAAVAAHNAANAAAAVLVPPGAAVAVPPMSAPPGVAGQLPIDWLAQLYRWIDTTLGQARANGLLHASQNSQFENFKITDVGIHRDTISRSYEALVRLNKQRNVPFGPMEMWIKFLGQITFPKMLANKALEQLQNPTFIISVGPNAGQPDLASLVTSFEELWHMIYDKGVEIKPQAAPRAPTERSNRVDGMGNWIIPEEFAAPDGTSLMPSYQSDNFVWSGITDAELHEACLVSAGSEAFAFVKNERNCWVCKGYGHTKEAACESCSLSLAELSGAACFADARSMPLPKPPDSDPPPDSPPCVAEPGDMDTRDGHASRTSLGPGGSGSDDHQIRTIPFLIDGASSDSWVNNISLLDPDSIIHITAVRKTARGSLVRARSSHAEGECRGL